MVGDFLGLSLATPDMLASLDFYRKLGFVEAPARDAWDHPYAVVTDGRIYLGLHRREAAAPMLGFALPDLRRHLPQLEALGLEFAFCNIELHRFNELGVVDPDGGIVALLEARTHSPVPDAGSSLCGYFLEYRLPSRDPALTLRFWENLGLIVTPAQDGRTAQVSWGGINLALQPPGTAPALVFENGALDEAAALLEMRGLPLQNDARGLRVRTPEGLTLLMVPEQD